MRRHNGDDFWATPDGRWGKGSPFATVDCALMLTELGVDKSDPVLKGAARVVLEGWRDDGRISPVPKGTVYPCHTATAARVLARLGYANDRRLLRTFDHLLEIQHDDGGWRCNTVRLGRSPDTDASNPGVTLAVLDAFRFTSRLDQDRPSMPSSPSSSTAGSSSRAPTDGWPTWRSAARASRAGWRRVATGRYSTTSGQARAWRTRSSRDTSSPSHTGA